MKEDLNRKRAIAIQQFSKLQRSLQNAEGIYSTCIEFLKPLWEYENTIDIRFKGIMCVPKE